MVDKVLTANRLTDGIAVFEYADAKEEDGYADPAFIAA